MMLGTTEFLIIGGIVVLLFGAAAIPKLARSLGQARKEFDRGLKQEATPEQKEPDGGAE